MFKFSHTLASILIIYLLNSYITRGNAAFPEDSEKSEDANNEAEERSKSVALITSNDSSGIFKDIDGKNAAFILVQELYNRKQGFQIFQLPSIMKEVHGERKLSAVIPAEDDEEKEKYLCPEIKAEYNSEMVQSLNTAIPATKSCLFGTKFGLNEPKSCAKEPIPWLTVSKNEFDGSITMLCSETKHQKLLSFEYNICDPLDSFLSFAKNIQQNKPIVEKNTTPLITATYQMYYICYDFKAGKPIWTKHQVLQPMLIYDPTIEEQNKNLKIIDEIDLKKMSTSTYDISLFPKDFFIGLKQKYESGEVNMKAYYLVPSQHMALPNWKKPTQHLINTASLQQKFHQLMNIIDEGLAKISIRKFTETGTKLHIFTKVDNTETFKKYKKSDYNIWYKFIYNEEAKSSALITLYNTPEVPEQVGCDNCLKCQFGKWADSKFKISEDLLKYVECCPISPERAKQLFQVDLIIQQTMSLQAVYRNFDKQDTALSFLKELGVKPSGEAHLQIVPSHKYAESSEITSGQQDADDSKQQHS